MVTWLKGNRKQWATRGSSTDHRICGRGWSMGLLPEPQCTHLQEAENINH